MILNQFFFILKEKTNAVRILAQRSRAVRLAAASAAGNSTGTTPEEPTSPERYPKSKERCLHSPGIPQATMDLSGAAHELSTLV